MTNSTMLPEKIQSKKYDFFVKSGVLKVSNKISGTVSSLTKTVLNELRDEWKLHEDVLNSEIQRIRQSLIAVEKSKEASVVKELSKYSDTELMTKDDMKSRYKNCYYFMTRSMGDGWLIDLTNHKFTMIDKSAITDVLDDKEEDMSFWKNRFFIGKREYNPYQHSILYDVEDGEITYKAMNTYYLPNWKKYQVQPTENLDPLMVKFFKHLFPEAPCANYVVDWINQSMFGRNLCYLVLIGEKRVGKGLLVDIISRVHRRENVQTRSADQAYDLYDGDLAFTTLISFDEITICNSRQYNYLKTFANDYKNYRAMHSESFTANNYANVIITLNKESAISALDTNDGRMSMPKITNSMLTENFSEDERKRLWNDEALIDNLVSYMFNRRPDRDMSVRHINQEKLEQVTTLAIPNYISEFLEICRSRMIKSYPDQERLISVYRDVGTKFEGKFKFCIPQDIVARAIDDCENHKNPELRSISQNKVHKFFSTHSETGKTVRSSTETKYKIYSNNDLLGFIK